MKNVMHLVVTDSMSGAEKIALTICKYLSPIYNPLFVCGGSELKKIAESNQIDTKVIDNNKNLITILFKIRKIIKNNDIKVVHAHDNKASIYALAAKLLFNLDISIVSHIHSCYPWLEKHLSIYKFIDRLIRNKYNATITCGNMVNEYYLKYAPFARKDKIYNISNFLDLSEIEVSKHSNILQKYNIDERKFLFGFVGRLSYPKGLIPFIKELAKNKDKFIDSIFLLVGSGDQEEEIRSLLKKLEIEDMFRITGYQTNIYDFYHPMDVFFLPSLYEGLPMVLLEAMVLNKPIVSMNVGGISELINDGVNGILIERNNYGKFIDALFKIKENEILREKFSRNSKKIIENKFDATIQIQEIEKIYEIIKK